VEQQSKGNAHPLLAPDPTNFLVSPVGALNHGNDALQLIPIEHLFPLVDALPEDHANIFVMPVDSEAVDQWEK
jgi:hypothetical protein